MVEDLKNLIKGDVSYEPKVLEEYSQDTSLFKVMPEVVVFPKDTEDVKKIVKYVSQKKASGENIAITARSAGSGMSGGSLGESIILVFTKYFTKTEKVGEDYAIVEPGVYYRDFEEETLRHNLFMPSFPASREICALGGIVANNAGGEKTLAYGKTEDYVRELDVVLADGNKYTLKPLGREELEKKMSENTFEGGVYKKTYELIEKNYDLIESARPKVSKNSAGYYLWNIWDRQKDVFDLTKLFVGSQGTLGIITKINIGLIHPKPHTKMLVIFLRNTKSLGDIIKKVLSSGPETFESYDDHTLKLAMRFFFKFVKILGSNIISLGFKFLPEARMVLTGGFPKLVLTAEFSGDSIEEVNKKVKEARQSIKKFDAKVHVTRTEGEVEKYRVIRRESFNLLRHRIKDKQTAPFIDDIVVEPKRLSEFLPRLEDLLNSYEGLTYTIAGHVGDGNFHIIPLMNLTDKKNKQIIKELSPKVYDLVLEYGGSITAEHNDGIIRSPFLINMYGEKVYELFKQVKNIYDPKNIFNPGKKVGASFDYAMSHLKEKNKE